MHPSLRNAGDGLQRQSADHGESTRHTSKSEASGVMCTVPSKYLNNLIEQDYRSVKQRIAVMIGFKKFTNAAITIAGIELMHRIRKGQFALARLGVQGQAAPTIWNAVLIA